MSSVGPSPLPGSVAITFGRPGVDSTTSTRSCGDSRSQSARKAAISPSPAAPGTSVGSTESMRTKIAQQRR